MSDKRAATKDDADLVLRLYELRREEKMRAAREWYAREFFPESLDDIKAALAPTNPANAYFRMVSSYWDMAASFVVHGALHGELLLESAGEMILFWAKIEEFVPAMRAEFGIPNYLTNIPKVIENVPWAVERLRWLKGLMPQYREQMKQTSKA